FRFGCNNFSYSISQSLNINLPNLEILEIEDTAPFQLINRIIQGTQGKLERIYVNGLLSHNLSNDPRTINQSILNSCPNLKVLTTLVTQDTFDTILAILSSCFKLECIALHSNTTKLDSNIILNHLALHPLRRLYNLKFDGLSWTFSLSTMKLFLEGLEKVELKRRLNITINSNDIDLNKDSFLNLFEIYYLKGLLGSYFIESEDEFDNWQLSNI
ncbi:10979_t:CDS:1, partial [Dentiscutata heterogama]